MLIKKRFKVLAFLLSLCVIANAQIITGKIVDSKNEPIEAVTIVVQTIDSVFVDATITDSTGHFFIKSAPEKYRLILQHLLFVTQQVNGHTPNIGTLIMKEQEYALNEVVIKGERPQVKIEDGALSYDMNKIAETKVISNAYESILQLPGVVEQNGSITLAGTNGVSIILDGKPTTMSNAQLYELLKSTPVSSIEKIQVMYSAPAKFHVRGAAINIVTQKKKTENPFLQGEINSSYIQRYFTNGQGGLNLSYSTPKLSIDFLYSLSAIKGKSQLDLTTLHKLDNKIYEIEQYNRGTKKDFTHNIRLEGEYNFNNEDKLSLAYTTVLSPDGKNTENSVGSFSNSINSKVFETFMHNISINYSSHNNYNVGVDYTHYNSLFNQDFQDNRIDGMINDFISDSKQKIDRIKVYADKSHEFANGWSFNYGAEFMYATDYNMQKYNSRTETDMTELNTDSNIKEYTYNAYAGFDKSFTETFSMSFSVIGEYYKLAKYDNWAVYPTLDLTYVPSSSHILQLSFSTDKAYPDYWDMQESVGYLNGYTEIHGNPYLKPSKDYSAQFIYILKSKYQFLLYYDYEPDHFEQLGYLSSERLALIYKTLNWNYKQMVGLNIVVPFSINNILDSRIVLNGYNNLSKCNDFYDLSFKRDKWTLYSRLDNTINISSNPNIKLELAAMYMTPSIQGVYDLGRVWSLDAGLKWKFAKDKAEILVKGTDLFNSAMPDVKTRYKSQHMDMLLMPDSRTLTVSFRYKFGGYKEKKFKEVDTSRFGQK